jgi:hypothetical protein
LLEGAALFFLLEATILLLLLDMLLYSSLLTYYSARLARLALLAQCCCSSCSMSLPFLLYAAILLLLLNVVTPFTQRYCSLFVQVPLYYALDFAIHCSSCFKLVFPPPSLFFGSVKEFLKFKIFRLDLEGDNFLKKFCLLMSFFNYPCFREMVVDNVFVYCV